MNEIENALNPIEGYWTSITRNTMDGWGELQIGIPNTWAFKENDYISIEILQENNVGKLLRIFPKKNSITIDDLVLFTKLIIETNKKIAEKEEEFKQRMAEMKKTLEKQAADFYKELDELKDNSFVKLNKGVNEDGKKESRSKKNKTDIDINQFSSPTPSFDEQDKTEIEHIGDYNENG